MASQWPKQGSCCCAPAPYGIGAAARTVKKDAESIVERQVAALNNGETTSEEVISYLNNLKPVG